MYGWQDLVRKRMHGSTMKSKKFLLSDTKRIRELGCSLRKSSVLLDPVYTDAFSLLGPGRPAAVCRFSKVPETFRARKAIAKSRTLRLQSCFIHLFLTLELFAKSVFFWTLWWFLGWISAKSPLIRSKMRLQHNSLPFLPSASRFSALWLGHAQKSKFSDEKVTYVFRLWEFWNFFSPFLFILCFSFCCL